MKKAFEQNVSRAKPRLRLGALTGALDPADPTGAAAAQPEPAAPEAPPPVAEAPDLSSEVRSRIERRAGPRPTAAEAMEAALNAPPENVGAVTAGSPCAAGGGADVLAGVARAVRAGVPGVAPRGGRGAARAVAGGGLAGDRV